ncbi:MAG: flagellar filament capping protein FliD [Planctomycetota bacterium]
MQVDDRSSIQYTSPVGESGIGVRAASEHNSIIRVYAHEVSHKAAARLQAELSGVDVGAQRVEIKVRANEEGKLVAAGGETTTELVSANGDTVEVSELALLSSFGGGGTTGSAAFFGDSRRRMPQLFLYDNYGSRLKIENSIEKLALNANRPLLERNIGIKSGEQGAFEGLMGGLSRRLAELSGVVDILEGREPYITLVPRSSREGVVEAKVTSDDAAEDSLSLKISSLARARQAAFAPVADNTVPLGVEGTFQINGVDVILKDTDSLIDLENLINRGEDANGNGRLDFSEDRNWNRTLDPREDANDNGVLDIDEDLDGDGVLDGGEDININGRLDASEDRNLNFRLDGGTASHGVKAFRIEGNRLILQADKPDGLFEVQDGEGLLASLGLITTNLVGDTVFADEVFAGSKAQVESGGETREFSSNSIQNYIPGVDLDLTSHFQFPVELSFERSASDLVGVFSGFREAFNDVQRQVNEMVAPDGLFRDDAHVGFIKSDLVNAVRFQAAPPPEVPSGLETFGFSMERHRAGLDEAAILSAELRAQSDTEGPLDTVHGLPTVRSSLGQFGITAPEDASLTINEPMLAQLLEQEAKNAEEALGGSALMGRLRSALESSLDPLGGHVSMSRASRREPAFEGFFEKIRKDAQLQSALGASINLVA